MNVFTASGNIGRDAEVRNAGGTSVAGFSLAVKSGYGDKAQTVWVDCSIWGKQAESGLVQYLQKGQFVVVTGELGTREHEGKMYITLRVSNVTLGGKQDAQKTAQGQQQQQGYQQQPQQRQQQNGYAQASGGMQRTQQQMQQPQGGYQDFDEQIPF
ncbi:Single-stranded DNA-binding protein ssb [compost metagenome]